MAPGHAQAKYHHYIPYFILKTFAENFTLGAPGDIASPAEVVPPTTHLAPAGKPSEGKGKSKKKKKKPDRTHQIKVYQVANRTTVLKEARRSYGIEDMYREVAEEDCMKFEKLLGNMECTSSVFIRKIWTGEDLSLTRAQLAELKKFLCIMGYRSEDRRAEFFREDFGVHRQSIYGHMRHNNIARIQDVWFENLKWFIKTPIDGILKEGKKAMISMVPLTRDDKMNPDRYKGPVHINALFDFGGLCKKYMCIWQAEEGSEFILSESCFGNREGDAQDPFHSFFVVSPRYCIVLVNRLEMWDYATHLPYRSWFDGEVHAFPKTTYKKGLPPPNVTNDFFTPEDVFTYRRIIVPKDDVYFVNSIFLDARTTCLTYKSSAALLGSLRYYDRMKRIRPDLFMNGHDYSDLKRQLVADMMDQASRQSYNHREEDTPPSTVTPTTGGPVLESTVINSNAPDDNKPPSTTSGSPLEKTVIDSNVAHDVEPSEHEPILHPNDDQPSKHEPLRADKGQDSKQEPRQDDEGPVSKQDPPQFIGGHEFPTSKGPNIMVPPVLGAWVLISIIIVYFIIATSDYAVGNINSMVDSQIAVHEELEKGKNPEQD